MSVKKLILLSCGLIVAIGVAVSVAVVWDMIREADQAERNLHALLCTLTGIEECVKETGRWPSSWEEIASFLPEITGSFYEMPADLPEVRSRVTVRFDITLEEFLNADSKEREEFVTPNGPCYKREWCLAQFAERIEDIALDSE